MSEMHYRSKDGRFTTKLVSETETGVIEQLFDFQNLFERNNTCGVCGNEDTYWNIRVVDDGSRYYEKKCYECGAALAYHCNKEKVKKGGLYSSWKDKWQKYVPPSVVDGEEPPVKGKSKNKSG